MAAHSFWIGLDESGLALDRTATTTPGKRKPCRTERTALNTLGAALRCTWDYLDWDTGPRVVGFFNAMNRLIHSIEPVSDDQANPVGHPWGFRSHTGHAPGLFEVYGRTRLCAILAALHHYRPPTKEVTSCAWFHEKAHPTSM